MSHVDSNHVAGEHHRNHQIQIGLFVFFILVWILDSFIFRFTAYIWSFPLYINVILELYIGIDGLYYLIPVLPGAIIIIIGVLLMQRSHIVFAGKEWRVVDHGIYRRIRHPMYLGSILLYVGFWVTTLSLLTLIPLLAVILGYNYLSNAEERLLEEKFGDEYREYKKRVPKFIPH